MANLSRGFRRGQGKIRVSCCGGRWRALYLPLVTEEELCGVPFNEVGEALRRSRHGRRMAGILLACFDGVL